MPALERVHADAEVAYATYRQLHVSVWRKRMSITNAATYCHGIRDLTRAKQPFGYLSVVEDSCEPPEQAVRQAIATEAQRAGELLRCGAVVHEGRGFQASAVRAVITGMAVLARRSHVEKVFDGLSPGAAWLAATLAARGGGTYEPAEIVAATEELRARIPR